MEVSLCHQDLLANSGKGMIVVGLYPNLNNYLKGKGLIYLILKNNARFMAAGIIRFWAILQAWALLEAGRHPACFLAKTAFKKGNLPSLLQSGLNWIILRPVKSVFIMKTLCQARGIWPLQGRERKLMGI